MKCVIIKLWRTARDTWSRYQRIHSSDYLLSNLVIHIRTTQVHHDPNNVSLYYYLRFAQPCLPLIYIVIRSADKLQSVGVCSLVHLAEEQQASQ